MNAEELMIGDWVQFPFGIRKVTELDSFLDKVLSEDCSVTEVDAIPLTVEILEKNFPKRDSEADYVKERKDFGFSVNWFPISDLDGVFFLILDMPYKLDSARIEHIHKGTFKYVHDVQHLLRVCGIDKEIEL